MTCTTAAITLAFTGWLKSLLSPRPQTDGLVHYALNRRASCKDIIESLGIPHTEVGSLLSSGLEIPFSHLPENGELLEVLPHRPPVDLGRPSLLRPGSLTELRFLADANVGKLARKLRMCGFDTAYDPTWQDEELAEIAEKEGRVLLSKDRGLLKRNKVRYGLLVREEAPLRQLGEVLHFFGRKEALRPYSRCIRCNGDLVPVEKEEILHLLEPLTKKYYHAFRRCENCRQIYWSGSHRREMTRFLAALGKYQPLPY
ncbi:Mut7-C RNAse domain-containing protein [Thiovibrio sp. JS02]